MELPANGDGRRREARGSFGWSVDIDGENMIVGTRDSGAYIFARNGGIWSQQKKLSGTGVAANDWFGSAVAMSGGTFVVGASGSDAKGSNSGAAYAYGNTPTLSISNVYVTEGNSGTTDAVFTVTMSEPNGLTVTVDYATWDASATAGADYMATSGTLTFAPGETTKTITVPVIGDNMDEFNEQFSVMLSNPTNAVLEWIYRIGTGDIDDDDPAPALSISDVSLAEGDSGTADAVFTLTLSAPSGIGVTVDYVTADGTASGGTDYQATSSTLTFAPGEMTKTIAIPVNGDTMNEPDETFSVNLLSPEDGSVLGQAVCTIQNDDTPPLVQASVNIDPDTLNLKSQNGKNAITAYIELPSGYDVSTVDISTVKLTVLGALINAQPAPASVGDYDEDSSGDLMVKFDRQVIIAALAGRTGDITLIITGRLLNDGPDFTGSDTVKVINQGKLQIVF